MENVEDRPVTSAFGILIGCFLMFAAPALADEAGTREEAVAMVARVQATYASEGPEATFAAITAQQPRFKDKDLYPFIYDFTGLSIAHGANSKMVGKMWINTKDQDGNYLIQTMVKTAQGPGSGWVNYKWPHPVSHKIIDKAAFVERLGDHYFVGVGIYTQ
jgi:cytochrome c